ncbi:MAG: hypothetical protein E7651_02745 [Ruminococcaceae bacterium]|nr:hypothetical protein [Oscillospiraceae bacterium]
MEFYSAFGKRPVRLSDATRKFAYDSLHCRYGKETAATPTVSLDHVENFAALTEPEKYDLAIREICLHAPLRICEGEKLSGSATLGEAIRHHVPASFEGKTVFYAVSHLTTDFETVVRRGIGGIREDVLASLERHRGTDREPFLQSCLSCLDSFALWHGRYLEALREAGYEENYQVLSKVPFGVPATFREALQSIWFAFAFQRLCGNWPGIGRIDWLLGDFLDRDLAEGRLTMEEARELLAHFFIKGCEWICGGNYGSGDAQHYQNLVIGGRDGEGKDITNHVTYLVLDVIEELGIGDFPTTLRLHKGTPQKLLRRMAEVIRYGGGVLAVYNEELIYQSLLAYGYPKEEVWKFANDGCWEVQIPGKTNFGYDPFDGLQVLQQKTLQPGADFATYEALYQAYLADLESAVAGIVERHCYETPGKDDLGRWRWCDWTPSTVISLFEGGCISAGLPYFRGGAVYNIRSPHFGGFGDTVNSLYAIRKLVYEERKCTLPQLLSVLAKDWEGEEVLRRYVQSRYTYFGNDNDECDTIAVSLAKEFAAICRRQEGRCGYGTPPGISTFGRQLEWAPRRTATPYGRKAGEVLAGNCSPTPGTDKEGATAVIRSYCKIDLREMTTGAALDLKLLPSAVKGEDGLFAIMALMQGFVTLGGFFLQLDVADGAILREAQAHPEAYDTLSVRVSGWNARFVTLDRGWQDMIIAQTEEHS